MAGSAADLVVVFLVMVLEADFQVMVSAAKSRALAALFSALRLEMGVEDCKYLQYRSKSIQF